VSGYVVDELALAAGLGGTGGEHERRELSRLISDAARAAAHAIATGQRVITVEPERYAGTGADASAL
jgi:hypothetical protein